MENYWYLINNDRYPMVSLSDNKCMNVVASSLKFIEYFSHYGHSASLKANGLLKIDWNYQIRKFSFKTNFF